MFSKEKFKSPKIGKFLISFIDILKFKSLVQNLNKIEMFNIVKQFYKIIDDKIEKYSGYIVKFVADEAIVIFPEEKATIGIFALLELKNDLKVFFEKYNKNTDSIIKVHFGEIVIGLLGPKNRESIDIFGENVNIAASLPSHNFSMTQQAFRCLKGEDRKLFKKLTPPIQYIPTDIEQSEYQRYQLLKK